MQTTLDTALKMASVGFLIVAWMVADFIGIKDPILFGALGSLIGAVPVWHVANNLPFSLNVKATP
jgi:hypothetical protein